MLSDKISNSSEKRTDTNIYKQMFVYSISIKGIYSVGTLCMPWLASVVLSCVIFKPDDLYLDNRCKQIE